MSLYATSQRISHIKSMDHGNAFPLQSKYCPSLCSLPVTIVKMSARNELVKIKEILGD